LLSWLTEGRPVIASQDGASSGAIYPETGGFDFSAFFFRINRIRGTVFLELFGPRSLPGVGAAFAPSLENS
jgi:hypothetical protein